MFKDAGGTYNVMWSFIIFFCQATIRKYVMSRTFSLDLKNQIFYQSKRLNNVKLIKVK